jgi:hypothetical protein
VASLRSTTRTSSCFRFPIPAERNRLSEVIWTGRQRVPLLAARGTLLNYVIYCHSLVSGLPSQPHIAFNCAPFATTKGVSGRMPPGLSQWFSLELNVEPERPPQYRPGHPINIYGNGKCRKYIIVILKRPSNAVEVVDCCLYLHPIFEYCYVATNPMWFRTCLLVQY